MSNLILLEQQLMVDRLLSSLVHTAASELDLTVTQAVVLSCIHRLERGADSAVTPARICKETAYSKPQVSGALAALDVLGFVTRRRSTEGDGRFSHLCLTPRGAQRAQRLIAAMLGIELELRDHMRVVGRSANLDRLATRLRKKASRDRRPS